MKTELHGAFVWDCHECGSENFERAISGQMTQEIADAVASDAEPIAYLVAPEHETDPETGEGFAAILVSNIILAPKHVVCKKCGRTFESDVLGEDEDDDA